MKTDYSTIAEKMEALYSEFIQKNDTLPNYAECEIQFKDDGSGGGVRIKLDCGMDENDDDIFYYCNGLNDLKGLTKEGPGADFTIIDFFSFE